MENHDVIIIGAGPAGLSAALRLNELGIKDVVVLEREAHAGGVPRHCGHRGFSFTLRPGLLTGPKFAKQLQHLTRSLDVRTQTTVLEFTLRGGLRVHSATGIAEMNARKIILATGTRESTAAARLMGGNRLQTVMNTGTLQQLVYLKQQKPFSKPVIIGNEWVTFSAILTCRHAGIKPVGIFSEEEKLDTPWYFPIGARLRYGVSTRMKTKLIAIHGNEKVERVEVERAGKRSAITCDGVIITGQFQPETALLAGRAIDVVKIGNVQGAVNTAGRCFVDARTAAEAIAKSLQ